VIQLSNYTTELRYVIASGIDIGLKDYPLYTFKNVHLDVADYRKQLNDKIIEHYNFREIGLETPQLFKTFLNRKMNEIMPYYNQMLASTDILFNPLWNVEMHNTYTHTIADNGKTTSTGTGTETGTFDGDEETTNGNETTNVDSDTPQSSITNDDIKLNVYASKTQHLKDDTTNKVITTNQTGNNTTNDNEINNLNNRTDTYTSLEEGSSAGLPYSNAIKQWREIIINIDMLIIEELEPLFMQLW